MTIYLIIRKMKHILLYVMTSKYEFKNKNKTGLE